VDKEFSLDIGGVASCLNWKESDFDDYCRQLCLKQHSESYVQWMGQTFTHNLSMTLWGVRERARNVWITALGSAFDAWPVAHPPVVLFVPSMGTAACLGCTWVDRKSFSEAKLLIATARARRHSVECGSPEENLEDMDVPIGR
jgi:hypothetical protein